MEAGKMEINLEQSAVLFAEAKKLLPGGVNSPVRAYGSVDLTPPFIARGDGPYIFDEDGNRYIDYVLSWGPLILGHRHPEVVKALEACLERGTSFGAPTVLETQMARMLVKLMPSLEMVRMVNSGTEATMSALRLARGYTGRDKIVKFEGCYHGHADQFLIKAGSGALTMGVPSSPGVPQGTAAATVTVPYNDLPAVEAVFQKEGENIAAVIVEPVAGNMGCIPPGPGFLKGLRQVTERYGSLLIFDEVMTGFRVALGGAQELYQIKPDLTCLGKIIGGGLPVGAYGGKREIMSQVAPEGPVYQAGTLSGNPLAMSAGLATLEVLSRPGVYDLLEQKARFLCQGMAQEARALGLELTFNQVGAMFSVFFTPAPVTDLANASKSNLAAFKAFFQAMLEQGVYLAPSQFEAGFISLAHRKLELDQTLEAAAYAFEAAREKLI